MPMKGQVCEVQGTCSFHLCLSGPGEIFMEGNVEIFAFCRCALQQLKAAHEAPLLIAAWQCLLSGLL